MFSLSRNFLILLVIAVFTAGASLLAPGPAQAFDDDDDGYWKNYWSWYDNDYRPHYYRHYRDSDRDYGRRDSYYHNRYYDSPYTYGYSPYTYGYRGDFDDRYRYDRNYRGRRNSIDVNGFRFEWR
jgi:hypothetical protein